MRGYVCTFVTVVILAATLPANPTTQPAEIIVDVSRAPELQALANRIQPLADEWYPRIAAMLPSDGFTPLAQVKITFDPDYDGVAYAAGDRIVCAVGWFKRNPGDIGAVVHELVHVVQQYPAGDHPGWLTEGIADYIRWFIYEPKSSRPKPDPKNARHTDSYRTSAHFLDYVQTKYDERLIVKLNAACREGKYTDAIWQQLTGRSLDQLGTEWKGTLGAASARITVDTSQAPDLDAYGQQVLQFCQEWYPRIGGMLPSEGFVLPQRVEIVFDPNYDGVAATNNDIIRCNAKWFRDHPEELAVFVHELVHVVQHYGNAGPRPNAQPVWLTEGIADHVRHYQYAKYPPGQSRPVPDPDKARHDHSYATSAHFVEWVRATYNPEFVIEMNAVCREGRYSEQAWVDLTGKTLEQLGQEWKASLKAR